MAVADVRHLVLTCETWRDFAASGRLSLPFRAGSAPHIRAQRFAVSTSTWSAASDCNESASAACSALMKSTIAKKFARTNARPPRRGK